MVGSRVSLEGTRRRLVLIRGAGTKFWSGGRPVGLEGSIGGRFLSGGMPSALAVVGLLAVPGLEVGVGAKAGWRTGGTGSEVLLNGDVPFGLPRERGRRLSSPLLKELATESWLLLFVANRCLRVGSGPRMPRFESRLGLSRLGLDFESRLGLDFESKLGLDDGDGLPLGGMGLRDGVRV